MKFLCIAAMYCAAEYLYFLPESESVFPKTVHYIAIACWAIAAWRLLFHFDVEERKS